MATLERRLFQRTRTYVEIITLDVNPSDPIEQTIAEAYEKPDSDYVVKEKHITRPVLLLAGPAEHEPNSSAVEAGEGQMLLKKDDGQGFTTTEVVPVESAITSPSPVPVDENKTKKGK